MMMRTLIILALLHLCQASNILVVFPFPSKSHNILGTGIVKNLLEAGHQVTYMTCFPRKDTVPNLREVDISDTAKAFPADMINLKVILDDELSATDMMLFFKVMMNLSTLTFENPNVQELMNNPNEQFDLVIVEWMFSEVYSGFSVVFNCPYVWLSSVDPHWMVMKLIDERLNPAYHADAQSANVPPFNFFQRVGELFSQAFQTALTTFLLTPYEKATYEKYIGAAVEKKGRQLPPFDQVVYNASLMLGNSHVSLGQATRLPQNYIPIGGYHIDKEVKPMSPELQQLLDNSKNGFIYFSMGSNIKSKDMPDILKESLLKMFATLKYTILWKFEEQLPNLPSNVHILEWAPQHALLSHPKCLLFITHGGLLSTTETVHFGVPIIGIPVFADQFGNVDRAVKRGFAKRVNLSYDMAGKLKEAIEEIVRESRYREKVKELSLIYHDRVVPPARELVHWVEHVVRTRGAPHLRSPALLVPWYQKLYLDFLALIIAGIYVVKYIFKKIFCSKRQNVSKNKKNK